MATGQKAQPTPWCDAPLHLKFYVLNWETDKSRRFPVVFPSTAFVAVLPCDMESFVLVGSIAVLNRKAGIWTSKSFASCSREIIHPSLWTPTLLCKRTNEENMCSFRLRPPISYPLNAPVSLRTFRTAHGRPDALLHSAVSVSVFGKESEDRDREIASHAALI